MSNIPRTKVQALMSSTSWRSMPERTNDLDSLNELLTSIRTSMHLPIDDLCSRAELCNESPELLASVYSLFHLSQLLMHGSMVPALSGHGSRGSLSREKIQEHTQKALEQAIQYARLLQQLVDRDLDFTRMWPISGYGAFMVGSVFLACRNLPKPAGSDDRIVHIPGPSSKEMKAAQMVLEVLSHYWNPLLKLSGKLKRAIEAGQSADGNVLTPSTYPGYTLEDHGPTLGASSSSSLNIPLMPNMYIGEFPEGMPLQEEERSSDYDDASPGPQNPGQVRTVMGDAPSHTSDSINHFVSFDDELTGNNGEGIFNSRWWNIAPGIEGWDFPATGMSVRNSGD